MFVKGRNTENAKGGTELMISRIENGLKRLGQYEKFDKEFKVFVSRAHEPLDEDKINIFWSQDLPADPESQNAVKQPFDFFVFVSNWQMQMYNINYKIPYQKSIVLENCIDTEIYYKHNAERQQNDVINLIYHTTPHRGLSILQKVYNKLSKEYKEKIHLHVYSSFEIYGWGERDEPYKNMFDELKRHEHVTYYGAVSNDEIKNILKNMHIFVYPSIWPETSCMCLMEAMVSGLECVHPNFAALPDTSANLTNMYQWAEMPEVHEVVFEKYLKSVIDNYDINNFHRHNVAEISSFRFSEKIRVNQWVDFLNLLLEEKDTIISNRPPADTITLYSG